MRKLFLIPILFLTISSFAFAQSENIEIDIEKFESLINNGDYILVDIRTESEIVNGVIEGSTFMNFLSEDFEEWITELDKDKKYILYCRSGNRSRKAVEKMRVMEVEAYSLKGGIINWENLNKPLIQVTTEK